MKALRESTHYQLDYSGLCQCADEASGNFFDFLPQGSERLVISVGDLPSGDPPPFVTISCLRALVRGLSARPQAGVAALMNELDRTVQLINPGSLWLPMFYASLDRATHRLQYANAGFESALLIRDEGRYVRRLEPTGPGVGFATNSPHRQKAAMLAPGDVLAVLSEGVASARDSHGNCFGDRAVVKVIRDNPAAGARTLAALVLEAAGKFAQRACKCDRTVAIVKHKKSVMYQLPAAEAEMALAAA